jgi:hypothetical protein
MPSTREGGRKPNGAQGVFDTAGPKSLPTDGDIARLKDRSDDKFAAVIVVNFRPARYRLAICTDGRWSHFLRGASYWNFVLPVSAGLPG